MLQFQFFVMLSLCGCVLFLWVQKHSCAWPPCLLNSHVHVCAIASVQGPQAAALHVAEASIAAFGALARNSHTIIVPQQQQQQQQPQDLVSVAATAKVIWDRVAATSSTAPVSLLSANAPASTTPSAMSASTSTSSPSQAASLAPVVSAPPLPTFCDKLV